MGQPVVHFEVVGKDGEKLQSYYSELFGWEIDANNPMKYGMVQREGNVSPEGVGRCIGPRFDHASHRGRPGRDGTTRRAGHAARRR